MKIYVGNLASDVTDDDLRQLFESFGRVESANVVKDKFSGESRGFGFVEMLDKNEAMTAMKEADSRDLKGRNIKVNEARARTDSSRSGGGQRGGFGGGGRRGGFGGGDRGGRGGGGRRY